MITTLPLASAIAICAAAGVSHTANSAVGTIAASITDLAKVFDPSSCAAAPARPERGDAGVLQAVDEAADQRRLRPHHDQVGGQRARQLGQALVVADGHIVQRGDVPDPGVPGRGVQLAQQRRARQPPRECVLAPAGSNE